MIPAAGGWVRLEAAQLTGRKKQVASQRTGKLFWLHQVRCLDAKSLRMKHAWFADWELQLVPDANKIYAKADIATKKGVATELE